MYYIHKLQVVVIFIVSLSRCTLDASLCTKAVIYTSQGLIQFSGQPLDTLLYFKNEKYTGCINVHIPTSFKYCSKAFMKSLTSLIEITEDNKEFHLVLWHPGHMHAPTRAHTAVQTHTQEDAWLAC